jgi:tRNA(His) 5'-end guanylyltransferase
MADKTESIAGKFMNFLSTNLTRLEEKGYSEDEVVAIDFDSEAVVYYMTNGDIVRITSYGLMYMDEDASKLH